MSKQKRAVQSYLTVAKDLAKFVPSLKKYNRRRTKLTRWEKGHIARWEHLLLFNADKLQPLSKAQAKKTPWIVFKPEYEVKKGPHKGYRKQASGVLATQMRNVGSDFKILKSEDDVMLVYSNKRQWIYWHLPETNSHYIKRAGQMAFGDIKEEEAEEAEEAEETEVQGFDIERVVEMARKAFERPDTKAVYLWSESGRVGEPMYSANQFARWIFRDYSTYQQTNKWVMGLALLIADVDEEIDPKIIATYGGPTVEEMREQRRKRRKYMRMLKQRGH